MSEPIIEYRKEFNVTDIARKYADRVACVIDEQTLANVEDQLAGYGYVKVVRCRDCVFKEVHDGNEYPIGERGSVYCLAWSDGTQGRWTKPDGFCHKGKRKEDSDD